MAEEVSVAALGERFRDLWLRCMPAGVDSKDLIVEPVFDELAKRYNEPDRYYHGWSHLLHCLLEFDRAAFQMDCPNAVELALWFHDVIFVPQAKDNEQLSADLFSQLSQGWFSEHFVEKVRRLILATKHKHPPSEGDERYIVDIDLASFGLPWPDYMKDTMNVRKELGQVPDTVFYPEHRRFLKRLLSRPRVFYTAYFHQCYEETARRNIQRLLTSDIYIREIFECE